MKILHTCASKPTPSHTEGPPTSEASMRTYLYATVFAVAALGAACSSQQTCDELRRDHQATLHQQQHALGQASG